MAERTARLIDDLDEIFDRIEKQNRKQKAILEQLDKVEQPYRLILEEIYIRGKTLVNVASELKYNYKYACRMHGTALKKFEEVDKSSWM